MSNEQNSHLINIFEDLIDDNKNKDQLFFGDIIEHVNTRGFGTALLFPLIITLLPTGGIPGVPAICAIIMIMISSQIILGRHHLWVPKFLKKKSIPKKKFETNFKKIKPYLIKFTKIFKKRYTFVTSSVFQKAIAVIIICLCLMVIVFGFVPFMAYPPELAILFLALGLTFQDGLAVFIGGFVTLACLIGLPIYFLS